MMHHQPKEIAEAPCLFGDRGQAWEFRRDAIKDNPNAIVNAWMIRCPGAHPLWSDYALFLIHLRDHEVFSSGPMIYLEGATHEIVLQALDPGVETSLDLPCNTMEPRNFAAQLVAADDEEAERRVQQAIQDICDGKLNPDTDGRFGWVERFGDNMLKEQYK